MKPKKRDLTVKDVTKVMALSMKGDRAKVYKAVEKLAKEVCGFTMFTILRYVEADKQVERVHTSNRKSYPVGGRKPIDPASVNQRKLEKGQVFVAPDKAAVKRTYFDYELIFSLGITAILNAPISAGGRRLGTLALSGVQGMYGKKEVERAKVLAGLLAPAMIAEMK
ncbi:MAG: GAF domain-containing protein [Alphaproteobacteria bacterium]|nr:GAF domain-containing protein [Alphaproteobacteria bacterium]